MKRETRERGTETHPRKGVLLEEVSNHQETLVLAVRGKFSNLRGQPNREEKLNKAHKITCLKATPSRKVPLTPAPAASKWGRNGEEPAALLRVRTGQKALRAGGGRLFLNCGREEKLTSWNTPLAVRKTKGLRNSREESAHPRWRKEAGGRGKGQTQPQRSHPLPPGKQARVPI